MSWMECIKLWCAFSSIIVQICPIIILIVMQSRMCYVIDMNNNEPFSDKHCAVLPLLICLFIISSMIALNRDRGSLLISAALATYGLTFLYMSGLL